MYLSYILVLVTGLFFSAQGQATFSNPIIDKNSADPSVLKLGNFYYLVISENSETELTIYQSTVLTNFRNANSVIAHKCDTGFSDLWAPEIHFIDGGVYVYFAMVGLPVGPGHRMYVIKANNATDPMAGWSNPIRLMEDDPGFGGIDGTAFRHGNGKLYYSWSSEISIFIAPMISPTIVGLPRLAINRPDLEWECNDIGCICEGPFAIHNRNVTYLVYSGSGGERYGLGVMSLHANQDPLVPDNWNTWPLPVFSANRNESVLGTGHASFTLYPDETETWMVYHAFGNTSTPGRIARIEKIEWDILSGTPKFPIAHGYNSLMPVPSGQI